MPLPLGINVLRSDGRSALAVAVAAGARFIRVNVHVGATLTDQGIIQGDAHALLRERRLLGARGPHPRRRAHQARRPLAPIPLEQEARDCVERGLADGLIVSGAATGEPTAPGDLKRVRDAVPEVALLVGSGATPETAAELLAVADGLIVGTASSATAWSATRWTSSASGGWWRPSGARSDGEAGAARRRRSENPAGARGACSRPPVRSRCARVAPRPAPRARAAPRGRSPPRRLPAPRSRATRSCAPSSAT